MDSDEETLGMDPEAWGSGCSRSQNLLREFSGIVRPDVAPALVPMHTFGHPCDLKGFSRLPKTIGWSLWKMLQNLSGAITMVSIPGPSGVWGH